jgi:hypothetical protein
MAITDIGKSGYLNGIIYLSISIVSSVSGKISTLYFSLSSPLHQISIKNLLNIPQQQNCDKHTTRQSQTHGFQKFNTVPPGGPKRQKANRN